MGIQVAWHDDTQTILRYTYDGKWTWDEFYSRIQEGNEMLNTIQHPVVSVVDMRKSAFVPTGGIVHIKRIIEISTRYNNTNITVFVGANKFHEMLVSTARRLYPDIDLSAAFHFVDDLAVGVALAQEIQQTL